MNVLVWIALAVALAASKATTERTLTWLVPPGLNYRVGRLLCRVAALISCNKRGRGYAEDALGTILIAYEELRRAPGIAPRVNPILLALGALCVALASVGKRASEIAEETASVCAWPVVLGGGLFVIGPALALATGRWDSAFFRVRVPASIRLAAACVSVLGVGGSVALGWTLAGIPVAAVCLGTALGLAWFAWVVVVGAHAST